jgi:Fe-S cluster biogenesis protein NfuA
MSDSLKDGFPIQVFSQWTPNPNAFKFIVSEFVISDGKATFANKEEGQHIPLVAALFELNHVTQVHLHENVVTVTQDGLADWGKLSDEVEHVLVEKMPAHDANFPRKKEKSREGLSPDILKIEDILDRTIRPGLQGDGGDVEVIALEDNILSIRYEGACGTCPSSLAGTLQAITGFLRDEYDPNIEVVTV